MAVGKREIFITFRIEKSDYFKRDGADIHTDATISLSQAILGGTIRVQGIYEDQTIQVKTLVCCVSHQLPQLQTKYNSTFFFTYRSLRVRVRTPGYDSLVKE